MTKIKGVLFDKDGTLLDFNALWIPIIEKTTEHVIAEIVDKDRIINNTEQAKQSCLRYLGIDVEEKKIDPEGKLANSNMTEATYQAAEYLQQNNLVDCRDKENLVERIISLTKISARQLDNDLKPTADLHKIFQELKNMNLQLGIATADNRQSTEDMVKQLEIQNYFDFIGCGDDDCPPKPHPRVVEKFCDCCQLSPQEVAFVGDTLTDMNTAINAGVGLKIAVLCGIGSQDDLKELADFVIETPAQLISILKQVS